MLQLLRELNAPNKKKTIKLEVRGENFSLDPCRPDYYNLVREKTNKIVMPVSVETSVRDLLNLCLNNIIEEG